MKPILKFFAVTAALLNRGGAVDQNFNKPRNALQDVGGDLEIEGIGLDLFPDPKVEARNFYAENFPQSEIKSDQDLALRLKRDADLLFAKSGSDQKERTQKALEMINHAIVLNPNGTWFYFDRGMYRKFLGDVDGAKKDFSHSSEVENDPLALSRTRLEIAKIYRAEGKYEESSAECQKIIELKVEGDHSFGDAEILISRNARNIEIIKQERVVEARKLEVRNFYAGYSKSGATKSDQDLAVDLKRDANLLFAESGSDKGGRAQKAFEMINHAIVLNPNGKWFYFDRGRYRNYLGDVAGAKEDFSYSLAVETEAKVRSRTHLEMAKIYRAEGKYEEYLAECKKIIELKVREDFSFKEANEMLRDNAKEFFTKVLASGVLAAALLYAIGKNMQNRERDLPPLRFRPQIEAENAIKGLARNMVDSLIGVESLLPEEKAGLLTLNTTEAAQIFTQISSFETVEAITEYLNNELSQIPEGDGKNSLKEIVKNISEMQLGYKKINNLDIVDLGRIEKNFIYDQALPQDVVHRTLDRQKLTEFIKIFQDETARYMLEIHGEVGRQEVAEVLSALFDRVARTEDPSASVSEPVATSTLQSQAVGEKGLTS
ncbi:MAG: hypothetical protein KA100_00675 [Rickettsiales bacterium]|nr:hypothetical protein [Rickettsiales bacterium]